MECTRKHNDSNIEGRTEREENSVKKQREETKDSNETPVHREVREGKGREGKGMRSEEMTKMIS